MRIKFNVPGLTGRELAYVEQAQREARLAGDGSFTRKCQELLESATGSERCLLTHSCTAALEMAALLADIGPGDEVILPSYTFVSTANAFVLRGAVPVFVDIRPDTLNIDEGLIEAAVTEKTRAIVPVHYAGVACEMDAIMDIAARRGLLVLEDAAQAVHATYKGRELGAIGELGCYSFHETKNVISGEGGALLINDARFQERAEIIREKGTNRRQFLRGQVDKYTWVDLGSSFLPSEIIAAFLLAQLEDRRTITEKRLRVWNLYRELLRDLEDSGRVRGPVIPEECGHNGHMYYLLANSRQERDQLLEHLREREIQATFHYIPLHSAPAGRRFGRASGDMKNTDEYSGRLLRLPIYADLSRESAHAVAEAIISFFK